MQLADLSCTVSWAQTKIFIGGGLSQSSFASGTATQKPFDKTSSSGLISGLANVQIEKSVFKSYTVFTGLGFNSARAHISRTGFSSTDERDITIDYLMIPIGISRKIFTTKAGIGWCSLAGYAAYAISGIEKGVYTYLNNSPSIIYNKVQIRSNNPDQSSPTVVVPFDFGLQAEVGFDINRFRICTKYLWGLKGVMANPDLYSSQYFNRTFTIALNYQCL